MSLCENELSAQGDEISKQSVYSRRWNLIFYRTPEFSGEDCASLVKNVLTENLKLEEAEVRNMRFCGVHRIGQSSSVLLVVQTGTKSGNVATHSKIHQSVLVKTCPKQYKT